MALSGPHQKFAEGIALGLDQTEAYKAAYPDAKPGSARASAARLVTKDNIAAEVERIRRGAEVLAGGCVLTLAMKRQFLYDLVTTPIDQVGPDSHLCQSYKRNDRYAGSGEDAEQWTVEEFKVPDKLAAIKLDNDLAGEGADAQLANSVADVMARIRSKR